MTRRTRLGPVLLAAALAAAAGALQRSGGGTLAPPALRDPRSWAAWLDGRDPVVAAFSLLRLAGLAALWYLVGATIVGILLRLLGAARLVAAADRLTLAPVRRVLAGISLGLAATTGVAVAGPAVVLPAAMAAQATATTTTVAGPVPTTTAAGPPATVTMHRLDPAAPAPAPPPVPDATTAVPAAQAVSRWTVQPGECFWTIAESVLTSAWGRPPTDAEIVPYWQRLIAANRSVLVHTDNPDLIFPGQVFQVPAP